MLAINIAETPQTIELTYDELIAARDEGSLTRQGKRRAGAAAGLVGTDVWTGKVVQHISEGGSWVEELTNAHDSRFIVFS